LSGNSADHSAVRSHPRQIGRDSTPASARSGNATLELAFVFLPLFAVLFAFVDFSMPIFLRSTLQSAVRAGVRYAVTYQTAAGLGQDESIRQVVQQSALGLIDGPAGAASITISYYSPADLTDAITGVAGNAPGNVVEVSVSNYTWSWIAPLSAAFSPGVYSGSPLQISVASADRMESLPAGLLSPPAR
jgi:Flp pilus assembly protein TadG